VSGRRTSRPKFRRVRAH